MTSISHLGNTVARDGLGSKRNRMQLPKIKVLKRLTGLIDHKWTTDDMQHPEAHRSVSTGKDALAGEERQGTVQWHHQVGTDKLGLGHKIYVIRYRNSPLFLNTSRARPSSCATVNWKRVKSSIKIRPPLSAGQFLFNLAETLQKCTQGSSLNSLTWMMDEDGWTCCIMQTRNHENYDNNNINIGLITGLERREYGCRDTSHWPCGTLYLQSWQ
jgi:hypothetical protein